MFQSTHRVNRVAVVGAIAVGIAVAVSSFTVVRAEHALPAGSVTYSCSSGTACVTGSSTGSSTYGVYGTSTGHDGVHGTTTSSGNSGVAGVYASTSGSGHGVYGKSMSGEGVYGTSSATGTTGVYGISSGGDGVFGKASNSNGPFAYSGVYGWMSGDGSGVSGESGDTTGFYAALYGRGDSKQTSLLYLINEKTDGTCEVNNNASLSCTGSATFRSVRTQHVNGSGQRVLAYGSESTSATIEDFGTARMHGGVATVYFERDFASTIDSGSPYYVFLTPLGDTRGLYVSIKTTAGFQVRETEGGRSRIDFDYRIVAHPRDAKNDRLPLAPAPRSLGKPTQPVQ